MDIDGTGRPDLDGVAAKPWLALLGPAALIALYCAWLLLPVDAWVQWFAAWIDSFGAPGVAAFAVALVLATTIMLPGAPFSIAAGVAYGWWGLPLVYVAVLLGATFAFLVSRYFFRDAAERFFTRRRVLQAVIAALDQRGWTVALLLRLSPALPFNIENYFWGITRIPFWAYVSATALGIVPGTALDIYLGIVGEEASRSRATLAHWVLLGIGIVATAVLGFIIARQVRPMLKRRAPDTRAEALNGRITARGGSRRQP